MSGASRWDEANAEPAVMTKTAIRTRYRMLFMLPPGLLDRSLSRSWEAADCMRVSRTPGRGVRDFGGKQFRTVGSRHPRRFQSRSCRQTPRMKEWSFRSRDDQYGWLKPVLD